MRGRLLLAALAALGPLLAAAGGGWRAPVEAPGREVGELLAVTLTSNVYAAVAGDLGALCVVDEAGSPAPSLLETVTTSRVEVVRLNCNLRGGPAALRLTASNELEFVQQLRDGEAPPCGLLVDTRLRDFQQQVRVDASDDGEAWRPLVRDATICSFERFYAWRHVEVTWSPVAARWYRVTISGAESDRASALREQLQASDGYAETRQDIRREPFRLESLGFWREEPREAGRAPVLVPRSLRLVSASRDAADGTETLELAGDGAPVSRIGFASPLPVLQRSAELWGWGDGIEPEGRRLTSGVLHQLDFPGVRRRGMHPTFEPVRLRRVRVRVQGGRTPLRLTLAGAEGPEQRLVFLAEPGRRYELRAGGFGGAAAAAPDAAAIRALMGAGVQPVEAALGAPQGATAARGRWLSAIPGRVVMVGGMAVAGLTLLALLLRASRRLG